MTLLFENGICDLPTRFKMRHAQCQQFVITPRDRFVAGARFGRPLGDGGSCARRPIVPFAASAPLLYERWKKQCGFQDPGIIAGIQSYASLKERFGVMQISSDPAIVKHPYFVRNFEGGKVAVPYVGNLGLGFFPLARVLQRFV